MKKFNVWILIAVIVLLALVGSVGAQDDTPVSPTPEIEEVIVEATEEATVVVEQPPVVVETPDVVVVESPSEDRLMWRELGLYAVVAVAVIALAVIAYRLVTMVGTSYPPGTSEALTRFRQRADEYVKSSSSPLDDLAFYLADPLVQNAIKAVKEREQTISDGNAVG